MYGYGYKYTASGSIGSNVNQAATIGTPVIDSITDTGFVISALVTPGSSPVTPQLQWGLTTAYAGTPVNATEGEISEATTVHFTVTGAIQNSLYHFKVVAGDVESSDATLTTLNTELITYETGLTTALSSAQRTRINTLISALKTATSSTALSEVFDYINLLGNETDEVHFKNIVKDVHHFEAVNAPTFQQFEGNTFNGTNNYLRSHYIPSTDAVRFTRNSACSGIYLRKNVDGTTVVCGDGTAADRGTMLIPRTGGGTNIGSALNSDLAYASPAAPVADARGMWISNRVNSTEFKNYRNGVLHNTITAASQPLNAIEEYIGCENGNGTARYYSTQQIAIRFRGRGLTDAEIVAVNAAFEEYMIAVGKSVKYCDVPTMALRFDDGYVDNYTILKDIFESRNKRFTIYFTTGFNIYLTALNKLSDSQVSELIAAGHDIQCHTHSHPNLTLKTSAEILAEYDTVNAYFAVRGWPTPKHTSYPGGSFDANVKTQTALRRLSGVIANTIRFTETQDMYQIPSYNINIAKDDVTALNAIKTAMDSLVTERKYMTTYGHRIYNDADADPFPNNSTQKSYIENLLDYADTKGIRVLTISQLYDFMQSLKVTV